MLTFNSVSFIKNYGKVDIRIRKLLEEKQMSRYQLAVAINSRFEVINNWYNGKLEKIDSDILARICYVLDCEPGDIIVYKREHD